MSPEETKKHIEDLEARLTRLEKFNKKYLIPLAVAVAYIIGVDLGYFPIPS